MMRSSLVAHSLVDRALELGAKVTVPNCRLVLFFVARYPRPTLFQVEKFSVIFREREWQVITPRNIFKVTAAVK